METENTNQHTEDCDEAYIGPLPNRVTIVWSSAVKFSVVQLLLRILFACMDTWDFTMFIFDNPYMVLITTRCVQSFIIWSLKVYDSGSIEFLGTHRSVYQLNSSMQILTLHWQSLWNCLLQCTLMSFLVFSQHSLSNDVVPSLGLGGWIFILEYENNRPYTPRRRWILL